MEQDIAQIDELTLNIKNNDLDLKYIGTAEDLISINNKNEIDYKPTFKNSYVLGRNQYL